jgi:hypothetical protein
MLRAPCRGAIQESFDVLAEPYGIEALDKVLGKHTALLPH